MCTLVDDLCDRNYFGVILTGGEPTLHPELPQIAAYARKRGLHVRMITNGWRLADPEFASQLADAGLQHVHVSVYSVRPEVEERLRGIAGTLPRAFKAVDLATQFGMTVDINCVINKLNADHLDENIDYWLRNHPQVRHFVWNNLDPSMGRAEVNQAQFVPRLADFEVSLNRALNRLMATGRTFRVEKVPLCYMTEFAWASTETRKIIKGEERIVHFLDEKQTVRQTEWDHLYAEACTLCSLRLICGGLFDRGNAYDPNELYPLFVPLREVVEKVLSDRSDPSFSAQSYQEWMQNFQQRLTETKAEWERNRGSSIAVGQVTAEGIRLFEKKRRAETRRAERLGIQMEQTETSKPT